jgi:hypothetical protein
LSQKGLRFGCKTSKGIGKETAKEFGPHGRLRSSRLAVFRQAKIPAMTRSSATVIIFFGMAAAHAGTLSGSVVGINDTPRPYVRVEFHGPQGTTTFTGADGKFSVELAMGSYVVQIIQGDRAARFNVAVPDKGIVTQSFKLTW